MKRYAQRCPAAIALDVVGERWTPLVIRELLLGPKRFTDLADGLPGIGTNILTNRLTSLVEHGVVEKRTLPRPTPAAVYELTEAGRALAPVLRELRAWGKRYGPAPQPGDAVQPSWILASAASRNLRLKPGSTCELRIGDEAFALAGSDDGVEVTAGAASAPDAVVTIEPRLFLRLAVGKVDAADARERIEIDGDPRLAGEVVAMLAGSAA